MKRAVLLAAAVVACAHSPPREEPPPAPPRGPASPAPEPAVRVPNPPLREAEPESPPLAPAEPPPRDDPFADVRASVDALLRAQAEALWAGWTRGAPVDLAKTYAGRDALRSPDTIRALRAAMLRADGDERRALSLLHGFLAGEYLARETAASAERLAAARAAATVTWDRQKLSTDKVPSVLAAERDASRRTALQRQLADAVARWAPLADAHVADLEAAARRLGHPSLLGLAGEIRGETPEELARLAERVLDATGPTYEAVMGALARSELGLSLDAVRGRDVPRMLRAVEDPRLFPAARVVADARALFGGLGLDVAGRRGVTLDVAAHPRKDPRPLSLPVAVPADVRLSAAPRGGVLDVRALLHEMAAATYYAHVESPRVEFQRLGSAVVLTWSLLFEEVAGDPQWLVERTGDTEHHLAPLVQAAAARRLHLTREAAIRVLLEVRRPRDAARAQELLERAYARAVTPQEVTLALAARDPLLHSADTLRASLLAAQAEAFLARRAGGGPWWREARNGAWLRRTFAEGSRPTAAELSRALGAQSVGAASLADLARERARWASER